MELKHLLIWIGVWSLLAIILTISDKITSKKSLWRVPEATLITVSVFGGSVVMYLTMRLIRHKTRHGKFMVGIPIIIVLQAALIAAALYFGYLSI